MHTNYQGKLEAALNILENEDFVYIHLEGPDECGHQGNVKDKILSIERLDKDLLKPLINILEKRGLDYSILIMPDHATPIVERTHTSDPVPYILYRSYQELLPHAKAYTEVDAQETGYKVDKAHSLMKDLILEM